MRLAVIDDEKTATDLLKSYLMQFENENHIEIQTFVFHHPNEFLSSYQQPYDIVILDIDMPGLNGIDTAKEIRRVDTDVTLIFITNMAQYALRGYEVQALDYILKPISYSEFSMKFKKALRYTDLNMHQKITILTTNGIVYIRVSDVLFLEVIRHYIVYHTKSENYTARGVLRDAEKSLHQFCFARINHSFLVNLKYVESISGNTITIAGVKLQISRNKKGKFLSIFAKYIGGLRT
ncbi:MAG: LytR/AlgR family response regulator transcription factor [Lachnospiraceae bacterium]